MTQELATVMDSARLWMIRVNETHFAAWDRFTEWLEADPRHRVAYEEALDDDAWIGELTRTAAGATIPLQVGARGRATTPSSHRPRRRAVLGGALAASLAAVMAFTFVDSGSGKTEIVTESGEHRRIALEDGSHVEINGDSHVIYDPEEPRRLTLARGEAVFEVEHDAANPFIVTVGETKLIDAGTIFNVTSDGDALQVGVAEGAVIYSLGAKEVELVPGDVLRRSGVKAAVEIIRTDPSVIGSWRKGVLHYDDAPLTAVARDLGRAVGKPVRVVPRVAAQRYTGTLAVEGPGREVMASVGGLLGVRVTESEDSWEITPTDAPPR